MMSWSYSMMSCAGAVGVVSAGGLLIVLIIDHKPEFGFWVPVILIRLSVRDITDDIIVNNQ